MRQELRGPSASDPVGRGLHNMFSGFITHQKLSEAPRELEALYDAWLIAGRLVEAGAVVPQIYRPMDDIFAVRWIPAVMDDEVKAVTEAVGAAFSHVGPEFLRISKAPAAMHPLLLGEIVLGLFIQSYIVAAWRTHVDETGDAVPEHHALFGCEPVDCDGDSALKAVGMRLEGWVAPVFLKTESHRVKGIVIVHDWVAAATAAKREGGDDVGARAGSAALAAMFGACEAHPEPVPLECPTFILLHGRQRVALQRVFKVGGRRTAGCGAQPHGRQKGRIIVDCVVVIQVFLADLNAGQTLDEVAELSASATTLLVGKRGGDDALDNVITT